MLLHYKIGIIKRVLLQNHAMQNVVKMEEHARLPISATCADVQMGSLEVSVKMASTCKQTHFVKVLEQDMKRINF